ncbi:hypothetical protein [Pueribacillus sp. YX66]|uniref:hypothetical protein n=1 Tax=Pueribacillus sp. YX66 TaxID=3229242 RepID=UPI00358D4BC1
MKKTLLIGLLCFLTFFLISCQSKTDENETEIPVTHENLTIEQLAEQSTLSVKLPEKLPFDPVDVMITLDDYKELYEEGEQIEDIQVRYIKTYREGRYIDVIVSNLEQTNETGETVMLDNGTEAIYAEDEIGQMLFWTEDTVNYRLVYYTSNKVNEGQEPLPLDEFIAIANSFKPISNS